MLALKISYEPSTTLGLFAALGYVPKIVQDQLLDLLASRATAVMTNVPGPTGPLTLAGSTLARLSQLGHGFGILLKKPESIQGATSRKRV